MSAWFFYKHPLLKKCVSLLNVLAMAFPMVLAGFPLPGNITSAVAAGEPVSYWAAEGNASDTVGANHGTLQGDATFTAGRVGQAFSFDGAAGNYVQVPDSPSLNPSGAFSVGGWFYIDPAASGNDNEIANFVGKSNGSSSNGWSLYFDDRWGTNSLKFVMGEIVEKTSAITSPGWYYAAGVYDPSAMPRAKLYLNGVDVADSGSWAGTVGPSSFPLRMGAMNWADSDRLNGKADEVKFYSRALTDQEIADEYSMLISRWPADGDASDTVGSNHGTLMNGTGFAQGRVGQAFDLDGVDDYVRVENSASLKPAQYTVEAWVYPRVLRQSNYDSVITYGSTGGNEDPLFIGFTGAGIPVFISYHNSGNNYLTASTASATLNEWHHIAATFDGTTKKLYLDGLPVATVTVASPMLYTTNAPLLIGEDLDGGAPAGIKFNGLVDEAKIYSRALTNQEIAEIYAQDITPPTTTATVVPLEPDGDNDWYVTTPTVTLTPDETAAVYYNWDTTATWVADATPDASVAVAGIEGTHTLYYRSVDLADNTETVNGLPINVDVTPPNDPGLGSFNSTGAPTNDSVIDIAFNDATDALSGIGGYSFSWTTNTIGLPDASTDTVAAVPDFNISTLAAGGDHTAGLKTDGTVVAVGRNTFGQASDVSVWSDIKSIAAGGMHTVGLKIDGTAVGVGYNDYGQTNISAWTGIKAVAAGWGHTIGLKTNGTVAAVGYNAYGQTNVSSWSGIRAIAAGERHTVGLKTDGTVVTAGSNTPGQTNVSSWSGIRAIAAGSYHTVGLRADGTVVAAGDNTYGQTEVSSWSNIKAVAAGVHHTVGLKDDGSVVATGYDLSGSVSGVSAWSGIVAVAADGYQTFGLKADDTVVGLGRDNDGETSGVTDWSEIKQPATYNMTTSPVLGDGDWWFNLRTKDKAGNWTSTVHLGPFNIDTAAPAGSVLINNDATYTNDPVAGLEISSLDAVLMRSADETAALLVTEYKLYNTTDTIVLTGADGTKTVYIQFKDLAGNESTPTTDSIILDTSAPTTDLTTWPDEPDGDNGWFKTWPQIGLAAGEPVVFSYQWDSTSAGGWQVDSFFDVVYELPLPAPEGEHTLYYRGIDRAGNTETVLAPLNPDPPTPFRQKHFKVDTGAPVDPTLSSPSHTAGAFSSDGTIDVNLSGASDGAGSGIDGYSYSFTTGPSDVPDAGKDIEEGAVSFTGPALSEGAWYFHLRTKDNAGNWTSTRHIGPFYIDKTAPTATVTSTKISTNESKTKSFTVSWSGVDSGGSGITSYDVQVKVGKGGAWTNWKTGTAATSGVFTGGPGKTYYFRARANDNAGNTGSYSAESKTIVPFDNNSLIKSRAGFGATVSAAKTKYYLGTARYSTKGGDEITYAFTGNHFSLIGNKGPKYSKAEVTIDGVKKTIDAKAGSLKFRQVLLSKTWTAIKKHTVKIKNLGTAGRTRFDIDGLGVGK